MAIFFPDGEAFGPIAFNASGTAPTALYIYPQKFKEFVGTERLWAFDDEGTLTDGPITDYFQTVTTDPDMSSATVELDTDSDSPYEGHVRVKFTMA